MKINALASVHLLCQQCDMLVKMPELAPGQKASCPRCTANLVVNWYKPKRQMAIYALGALFMLSLSLVFPFISMRIAGHNNNIHLLDIPTMVWSDDYISLSLFFLTFVLIIPLFCLFSILLFALPISIPVQVKHAIAKGLLSLKSWNMPEIFLAGILVSFVKLMAYGDIQPGLSFVAYVFFCLLQIRALLCLDKFTLWQMISPHLVSSHQTPVTGVTGREQGLRSCRCCLAILPIECRRCPRCATKGYARQQQSLQWTLSLLLTALLLYIPANILPMMKTQVLGDTLSSTILGGIILLWSSGSYPVAIVIFIASIMVPTLKMSALAWLCWDAQGHKRRWIDNERMHVIYEIVEFIGRWSMVDIFVITVLASLVRLGQWMNVYPAIGALLFALVVVLSMFAAITFDPRLIWDRKETKKDKKGHL